MGSKLYVGNINFNTTEEQLKAHFEGEGRTVTDVRVITDRETGRPRGFAFVTLSSDDEARAAMEALDGAEFEGRPLRINEAFEKERNDRGGAGGGGGGDRGRGGPRGGGGGGGGRGGPRGGGGGGDRGGRSERW